MLNSQQHTGARRSITARRWIPASVGAPANGVIAAASPLTLGGGKLNILGASTTTAQSFASTALTANTMSTISLHGGNLGDHRHITRNAIAG